MTSFDLSTNYVEDLEELFRRTKAKLKKVSALESEDNQIRWSLTLEFQTMADKTIREFSAPTTANIRTGPTTNVRDNGFELKPLSMKSGRQSTEGYAHGSRWIGGGARDGN